MVVMPLLSFSIAADRSVEGLESHELDAGASDVGRFYRPPGGAVEGRLAQSLVQSVLTCQPRGYWAWHGHGAATLLEALSRLLSSVEGSDRVQSGKAHLASLDTH